MPTKPRQNKWGFGLGWIVANGIAWGIFYLIDILVRAAGSLTDSSLNLSFFHLDGLDYFTGLWIGALVCGLLWGLIVGLVQRLALFRRLKQKGAGWIVVTMLGLLPLAVYLFLYQIFTSATSYPGDSFTRLNLLFILMEWIAPIWFALAQWLVLRRSFRRSAGWIAAVTLLLALVTLTFPLPALSQSVFRPHHAFLLLAPGVLGGLYAIVTWFFLTSLPLRTRPILSDPQ